MTEEFSLRPPRLEVCICGAEFCIELCQRTAEICGEILEEAKAKLASLKSKDGEKRVRESDICSFLKVSIDRLLGEGSVDKIFGKRRQELLDLSDVMCFVVSKIRDGFERERTDEADNSDCE